MHAGIKRVDGKREREAREAAEQEKERARTQAKMARNNDEGSVASARERYLARKKAAAAAKAAAAE
eukprot:COSAG01_NODE_15562_length_1323_cov_2.904412_2_plen_66_part_00